ncbi:MAG: hypothetical protein EOL86_06800 [Deltaproteobacteria bacterium]|nr:hypothetical protein [Deltaproteobacteria bacterium]
MSSTRVTCPYCEKSVAVDAAVTYEPIFQTCPACGRRFIVERTADGVRALREKDAPCMSNPDCRDVEMSGSCEE